MTTTLLSTEQFSNKISTRTFCDNNKIPYVLCCVRVINGEKDIKSVPKGWMDWSFERCCTYNKSVDVRCQTLNVNLRNSKYMIIDIDLVEKLSYGLETFGNEWVSYSTRRKLPHIWRSKQEGDISPDATNVNNDGFDLRYTNIFEDVNNFIYFNEETIPEFVIHDHPNPKIFAEKKQEVSVTVKTSDDLEHNKSIEFLDIINESYWTEFDSWKRLIMAISATFLDKNEAEKLALHFSAKSTGNFDEQAVLKLLETEPKTVSVGTIRYYAKKSDEVAFADINAKYKLLKKEPKTIDTEGKKIANNDLEASTLIYNEIKNKIVFSGGVLYCKTKHVWIADSKQILAFLSNYVLTSEIKRMDTKGGLSDYVQNRKSAENVAKCVIDCTIVNCDNLWAESKISSSFGYILFMNGYYSFKETMFYNFENPDYDNNIVFLVQIPYDCVFDTDEAYIESVNQRMFVDPFGAEISDFYKTILARGLAGDNLKTNLFGIGDGNSGKSTISLALGSACGGYVGEFNGNNLIKKKFESSDEAQKCRWLSLLQICRIIISNEIANQIADGNILKRMSGGDKIIARGHSGDETSFKPRWLPITFANDLNKISPMDSAIQNRIKAIEYKKIYVENPSNDLELKIDTDFITTEIYTPQFKMALMTLLMRAYNDFLIAGTMIIPEGIKNANKAIFGDVVNNNIITKFLDEFEITKNENDFVSSSDIDDWLKSTGEDISTTKFSRDFSKYLELNHLSNNIFNKYKKIQGKTKLCWFGIRLSKDNESE